MFRGGTAITTIAFLASAVVRGAPPDSDPAAMLRKADAPHAAFSEGLIRLRVTVNERGKKPEASLLDVYVKGSDRSLVVFREGKQKGRKILTVEDRVVLIVPGASKPIPVSKTQRLMGAASFGDIARLRLSGEYDATLRPADETVPGEHGDAECHVLDLTAKTRASAYPVAELWLARGDGRARQLRLSLASGKAAKEIRFTAYDGRGRVAAMEIHDLLNTGGTNVTRLQFESYEEKPLDPTIFDPEGARAAP